jgi:hypothetical protein
MVAFVTNLPTLIELKLASGMTNAGRLKDLADVQELIKHKVALEFRGTAQPIRAGPIRRIAVRGSAK